ncbi:MAG: hypothetical protein JWM77_572 [Rhodospirillales bacterium]|nr:hypothetical protein [Rhodospirillales bacterium]
MTADPSNALSRLERTSRRLADLFSVLVITIPLFSAFSVFALDTPNFRARIGWDHVTAPISMSQRVIFVLFLLLMSVPTLVAFLKLRALFLLYAQGVVFAPRNVMLLRRAGLWLLWSAAFGFLSTPLLSIFGSWGTSWRNIRIELSSDMLLPLIAGGTVYAIAHVMDLAREAEEERAQFV